MDNQTDIRVLIVDDAQTVCDLITESLRAPGYTLHAYSDPAAALAFLEENYVDIVLTDLMMGEYSGEHFLETALKKYPDVVVILMTAHPTITTAISALKRGAFDFLIKPFKLDLLKAVVARGLAHQRLRRENVRLHSQVEFLSAANACGGESNIAHYLRRVLRSCKTELSASAGSILLTDPRTGAVTYTETIGDDESERRQVSDEQLLQAFTYTRSSRPIVRTLKGNKESGFAYSIRISKPILVRRTLHGAINLLIPSHSREIPSGQLDVLTLLANSAAAAVANDRLYRDLQSSYLQAIRALANAIEARDHYTAGHTDRVTVLATAVAQELGWQEERLQQLLIGCTLHDIGKIGVPDAILNKPGKLTDEERRRMTDHPMVGLRIIEGIDLLKPAIPYILSHHERYDGTGYPRSLKGEEIPIEGRLLAVVDTFDAMISDRPYRKGAELDVVVRELLDKRGSQFDPYLVDLFLQMLARGDIDLHSIYHRSYDVSAVTALTTKTVPV